MISFTVIGGYLGAGKTTLLNRMLSQSEGRRIGLLVNDFGEINIDGSLIASQTDSQINLTNGCVCCSLSDGFHEAIDQLMEISPPLEQIIVEASGVANVRNLSQYGHAPDMSLDSVLVLADAETVVSKANDKYVAGTVRRQLEAADLILLNKVDLLSEPELDEVKAWLADQFPDCPVLTCSHADVPLLLLTGLHHATEADASLHSHEEYEAWHLDVEGRVEKSSLEQFVTGLGNEVIRAKGLVSQLKGPDLLVQVVGNRREITELASHSGRISLVAIGLKGRLDRAALDSLATVALR